VEMDRFSMFCGAVAFFMLCHIVHTIAVTFFSVPAASFFVTCCLLLLATAFCFIGYDIWSWISKKRRDRDVKQ